MITIPNWLRRRKRLLAPFRTLHYRMWQASGISGITKINPELQALRAIASRGAAQPRAVTRPQPTVLFFTFRSWNTHAVADALIAHALLLRGASVHFFTCGGRLPVCDIGAHTMAPPMPCNTCAPYVSELFSALGLPSRRIHDYISAAERADIERLVNSLDATGIEGFEFDGLPIGRLVRPSVQWFLLSGNPPFDAETVDVWRRFLVSGAILSLVAARLLDEVRPDKLYLLNGIFFAERIAIEHALRRNIPFITHEGGFMPDTHVFTRNGFAPHYDLDATWQRYSTQPLQPEEERALDAYLGDRMRGRQDVSQYYPDIESDTAAMARQLGLTPGRPLTTLFTNVDWDTATFAARSAFDSMEAWLAHTVRHFGAHPGHQLVIRVHPAEVRLPMLEPREGAVSMLRRLFPDLPPNVRVIAPESPLSSYTLMQLSDVGLAYTSTTGLEMSLLGKPVVTAGRGFYANKGFTLDAATAEEYDALLAAAGTLRITPDQVERARRYAFLFFFRHHIRFTPATSGSGRIRFNIDSLAALEPGNDRFLDLICDGILNDAPFLNTGEI